jgi:hypothetical protein
MLKIKKRRGIQLWENTMALLEIVDIGVYLQCMISKLSTNFIKQLKFNKNN